MSKLYVNGNCPHSRRAVAMLAKSPTTLKKDITISEITDYKSGPPSVTQVPTLITQDGKMLVGKHVFNYLKRKKQESVYPQTPDQSEMFHGLSGNWKTLLIIIIIIVLMYFMYKTGKFT